MKRSRFSFLRTLLLVSLTGLFMYSASVQEIHYLFVDHHVEVNEHCHNHLHTQTGHLDCSLCKVELSSYVQSFQQYDFTVRLAAIDKAVYHTLNVILTSYYSSTSPRGPPAIA